MTWCQDSKLLYLPFRLINFELYKENRRANRLQTLDSKKYFSFLNEFCHLEIVSEFLFYCYCFSGFQPPEKVLKFIITINSFSIIQTRSHGGMKNRNSWMNVPGWRSGPHTWQNQGSGGPSQDREIRKNCFNPLEKPNSSCAHSLLMSMGNAGALVLCKSYVLKNFCLFYLLLFIYLLTLTRVVVHCRSCALTTDALWYDLCFVNRGSRNAHQDELL